VGYLFCWGDVILFIRKHDACGNFPPIKERFKKGYSIMPIYITCDGCHRDLGTTVSAAVDDDGLILCPLCRVLAKDREVISRISVHIDELLGDTHFMSRDERNNLTELQERLLDVRYRINLHLGMVPF
jgi:hypothetical protein